jgi:hypothetical protein
MRPAEVEQAVRSCSEWQFQALASSKPGQSEETPSLAGCAIAFGPDSRLAYVLAENRNDLFAVPFKDKEAVEAYGVVEDGELVEGEVLLTREACVVSRMAARPVDTIVAFWQEDPLPTGYRSYHVCRYGADPNGWLTDPLCIFDEVGMGFERLPAWLDPRSIGVEDETKKFFRNLALRHADEAP